MRTFKQNRTTRHAFTLIELLAVVFIIVILVAMTAGALFRMRASQDVKRTENDIQKIASGLDMQWKATVDLANKQLGQASTALDTLACGDLRRKKALWTKINLKREFPTTVAEAVSAVIDSNGNTYLPVHQNYFNAFSDGSNGFFQVNTNDPATKPTTESAVCLYLALTTARGGAVFNPDQVGSSAIGTATFVGSKSGTTKAFKMFIDAWGQPIGFVRWNAPNNVQMELDSLPSLNSKRLDRDDPEGALLTVNTAGGSYSPPKIWVSGDPSKPGSPSNADIAATMLGLASGAFGQSHNFTPYVVSMGRDRALGNDDDILSFRLRKQGDRGN